MPLNECLTFQFMLPGFVHTMNQPPLQRGDGPSIIVLAPTRELAQQVHEVTAEFAACYNLRTTCCFGGASKGPQAKDLERGGSYSFYFTLSWFKLFLFYHVSLSETTKRFKINFRIFRHYRFPERMGWEWEHFSLPQDGS